MQRPLEHKRQRIPKGTIKREKDRETGNKTTKTKQKHNTTEYPLDTTIEAGSIVKYSINRCRTKGDIIL